MIPPGGAADEASAGPRRLALEGADVGGFLPTSHPHGAVSHSTTSEGRAGRWRPPRAGGMLGLSHVKALVLTREYPPNVYGGAGVVVDELTRALSRRMSVEVRCFGEPRGAPPGIAGPGKRAVGAPAPRHERAGVRRRA